MIQNKIMGTLSTTPSIRWEPQGKAWVSPCPQRASSIWNDMRLWDIKHWKKDEELEAPHWSGTCHKTHFFNGSRIIFTWLFMWGLMYSGQSWPHVDKLLLMMELGFWTFFETFSWEYAYSHLYIYWWFQVWRKNKIKQSLWYIYIHVHV